MRLTACPRSIISIAGIDGTELKRINLKMRKISRVITQMIMEIQIKITVLVIKIARARKVEGAKEK